MNDRMGEWMGNEAEGEKGRKDEGGKEGCPKELQKMEEQGEVLLLFFAVYPLHLVFVLQMVYDYALCSAPSLLFHRVKPSLFLGEKEVKWARTHTLTRARLNVLVHLHWCV